jgi:tetratricopeptide (TPR) repeat protein
MKFLTSAILLVLFGCASAPDPKPKIPEAKSVPNEAFKKEKQLKTEEVLDYYTGTAKALSPALQDETLDRYSDDELTQFVEDADPLLELSLLCREGDFDGAFKRASQVFNRYQKVAMYWNLIANCHLNSGSYRKALLFYNKALEIQPNYVPALNNVGVMYSRQGQHQKALVAFERAYNQSRFSKTPRYNLAKLYLTYGLAQQALPIFQGLLNSAPADVDLLNAVGTSHLMLSDYQSAMSYYQRIPAKLWSRAEIGLNIALTMKKLNKPEDARKTFLAVRSPDTNDLKRYYASVGKILGSAE